MRTRNDPKHFNQTVFFTDSKPRRKTTRTKSPGASNIDGNSTINITSSNIEGVKGNAAFLIDIARSQQVICLQETWVWTFESTIIENIIPNYNAFIRCEDMNENISNFQAPRGKAGIAIVWPKEWSGCVKSLQGGNERIQAIELCLQSENLCIINAYLPTLNLPASKEAYAEHLDILHNLIDTYANTHKVILCGDLNGSLQKTRNNPHDVLLKYFVQEHDLLPRSGDKPTFYGHGGSTSQIDYILSAKDSCVQKVTIADPQAQNLSTHVTVTAKLDFSQSDLKSKIRHQTQPIAIQKFHWDKIDELLYQQTLQNLISESKFDVNADNVLTILTSILSEAAVKAVPRKQVKLKGPNFKLSPRVKELEQESKRAHYAWKAANCPLVDHPLSIQRKLAKYTLRKQTRKEFACAKDDLFNEIMEHPTNQHFYKLIRRSQASASVPVACLMNDGKETTDLASQRSCFAAYFEDLAVPKTHENFNENHLNQVETQVKLIQQITNLQEETDVRVTEEEVEAAIAILNTGKAPDESHLTAEHLKRAGKTIIPTLTILYNKILSNGEVPYVFKSGIITPIHKKGKDAAYVENYRGITITSVLSKVFEVLLLKKMTMLNDDQSELQFGFTKGLSPSMASLLLSESVIDAKNNQEPLYIATLDSQKAFDVVHHQILLSKLYHQGITGRLWTVISSMYTGLTGKVKWFADVSDDFNILQGVRQGGILSTHFYKTYINNLLLDIESQHLGKHIGTTYVGCPTCADDVLLMSNDSAELQSMLNIADSYAGDHRYLIHPLKSSVVRRVTNSSWQKKEIITDWVMGNTEITVQRQTTHLGLNRTAANESTVNVEERIKLARRTLYALMRTGVHGTNGINPKTSYKIYQTYVIPRLLYSTETLTLTTTQIQQLERFHNKTLKNLQSLPVRTATSAVLLLIGALPIEAEIDRRQLSLVYSIIHSKNQKLKNLMDRQLIMKDKNSFFTSASNTLEKYGLPSMDEIHHFNKVNWKRTAKSAVESFWTGALTNDAKNRTTLQHCNTLSLRIGQTHPVWSTVKSNTRDVKCGITKARLLTGTYLLQANKAKFNKYEVDETCPLCRLEAEDVEHMLTRCPALIDSRTSLLQAIQRTIVTRCGQHVWSQISKRNTLTSLIIDCTTLVRKQLLPDDRTVLTEVEEISRKLCQKLHVRRLNQQRQLNQTKDSETKIQMALP
ncbi:MAG: reverse transcriptase family protein [Sedimenticola sp.]